MAGSQAFLCRGAFCKMLTLGHGGGGGGHGGGGHGGGGHGGGGHGHGGGGRFRGGFGPWWGGGGDTYIINSGCQTQVYSPVMGSDGLVYYNTTCLPAGVVVVGPYVVPVPLQGTRYGLRGASGV